MKIPRIDRLVMSLAAASLTLLVVWELVVPSKERGAIATIERSQQPEKPQPKDNITYYDIAEEIQPNGTKNKNLVRFLSARQFDGRNMTDIMTIDLSQCQIINVTDARSGKWDVNKKSWDLANGTTYAIDLKSKNLMQTKFDRLQLQYL